LKLGGVVCPLLALSGLTAMILNKSIRKRIILIKYHSTELSLQIFSKYIFSVSIILPVVLYGCETWSLTLREEGRLSVFENRVLRRIFGPRRDGAKGE